MSETILGNVIKKLNLPREELVVMTKVVGCFTYDRCAPFYAVACQTYNPVPKDVGDNFSRKNPDEHGYINQWGL